MVRNGEINDIFGGWKALNNPVNGGYFIPNHVGGSTVAATFPFARQCNPFPNYHTGTIDVIDYVVTTAPVASTMCAVAVYGNGDNAVSGFAPSGLLYADATATDVSLGTGPVVSSPSLSVQGGTLYWLCLWCSGGFNMTMIASSQAFPILGNNIGLSGSGQPFTGIGLTSVAFPSPYLGASSWPASFAGSSRLAQLPAIAIHYSN